MEERKLKRKSPRTSTSTAAPTGGSGRKSSASSGGRHAGYSQNAGTHSSQKSKSRRAVRDKPRQHLGLGGKSSQNQGQAAPIIQHSFLTDVSDVQEMENGLLSLLNDFHSGKLQAFGNECSIGQMEHVREMQEKLARLHFDLYGEVDEMPEDQRKMACDTNMDKLLLNLEELSSSMKSICVGFSAATAILMHAQRGYDVSERGRGANHIWDNVSCPSSTDLVQIFGRVLPLPCLSSQKLNLADSQEIPRTASM